MTGGGDAAAIALATRRAAGLFALAQRGIVEVSGEDRIRWLDGMLTRDMTALAPGPERSGCRALVLSRKGQVLADLRVWLRPASVWLETEAAAIPGLLEHLAKLVVADDVRLASAAASRVLLGLEGPASREVLARAAGRETELAPGAVADREIAGAAVAVAAYGETGEEAFRIAAPAGSARAVGDAIAAAGAALGLVAGTAAAFEILRIEAGTPRFGAELRPDALPAELLLEAAIDFGKGCYTGQEIVARVESRGRVRRRLAGVRVEGARPPEAGEPIAAAGAPVGEITSGCASPVCGAIGLGMVRIPHDAPGTELVVGGRPARAAALPFVRPGDALGRGPA